MAQTEVLTYAIHRLLGVGRRSTAPPSWKCNSGKLQLTGDNQGDAHRQCSLLATAACLARQVPSLLGARCDWLSLSSVPCALGLHSTGILVLSGPSLGSPSGYSNPCCHPCQPRVTDRPELFLPDNPTVINSYCNERSASYHDCKW